MPIRQNRAYNDPNIGRAFDNLAAMFAPPSAQETAAYANAKATSEEAARRQRLMEFVDDPEYSFEMADRLNYAVNGNANNTHRALELESADRRFGTEQQTIASMYGYDRTAASARYGHDRTFEANRLKTADDNATTITTTLLAPVQQGAIRFVPQSIAEMYGVDQQQAGSQAPLSDTQVQGAARQQLMDDGLLTPEMQLEAIMGERAPVQVAGPNGPQYATPGRATREGLTPYNAPSNAAVQTENYTLPDGAGGGTAVFDPTINNWRDTATREPLPQGSRTYTGQLQGGSGDTGFGATNSNLTEATRLESSLDAAQALVGNVRSVLAENPNVAGIPGRVKGVVQSLTSSAQQVAQAYAEEAPDMAISLDEARRIVGPALQGYDPSIQRVASAVYDLAYMRAQIGNPGGEVSRQAFERALESFGQTYLSSQQDLATALDAFETDTIGVNRVRVNSLRGQRGEPARPTAAASTSTSTSTSTGVPEGVDPADWQLLTPEERRLWQ